jgi:hypothetical protein
MKFNSQICTTREQSERLLALGLKKETADIVHYFSQSLAQDWTIIPLADGETARYIQGLEIPAWSLDRLLALVNGEDWRAEITLKDERYGIHYGYESYWYDDIFEAVIAWIEDDIKEGYFNKEYLQEQADSRREE